MHIIAAKGVALGEALQPGFQNYSQRVVDNAKTLSEALMAEGLTLVSGGTDNHLMLLDTRSVGTTGKAAEHLLDQVGITVNKNAIPYDPASPFVTSGIRIGTPSATARGMDRAAMGTIAKVISMTLKNPEDASVHKKARDLVRELTAQFPIYEGLAY